MSLRRFGIFGALLIILAAGTYYFLPISHGGYRFSRDMIARQLFQKGIRLYNYGNKRAAVTLLNRAGLLGYPAANWKLAYMYAHGDGIKKDPSRAYNLFLRIVLHGVEFASVDEAYISDALVQIGLYFSTGIKGPHPLAKNLRLARQCFFQAAANYRNSEAQYLLGKMILEGQGGKKSEVEAARWFHLAARKKNADAQIALAQMLLSAGKPTQALLLLEQAFINSKDHEKSRYINFLSQQALVFLPENTSISYLKDFKRQHR